MRVPILHTFSLSRRPSVVKYNNISVIKHHCAMFIDHFGGRYQFQLHTSFYGEGLSLAIVKVGTAVTLHSS